jgi:hypothetical protein
MTHYRCYFLNEIGKIRYVEAIECADDDTACALALARLRGRPDLAAVELWDSDRKVLNQSIA